MLRQYEYSCFPRFESASFSHFVVLVLARQCAVCAGVQWLCADGLWRVVLCRSDGFSRGAVLGGSGDFSKPPPRTPPVSHILYTRRPRVARTQHLATCHAPQAHTAHTLPSRLYNSPRRPHTLSHRSTLKSGRAHKSARRTYAHHPYTLPVGCCPIIVSHRHSPHTHERLHTAPPKRMRRQLFTNGAATCATAP